MVLRISALTLCAIAFAFGVLFSTPQPAVAQSVSLNDFSGMDEGEIRSMLITLIQQLLAKSHSANEEIMTNAQAKINSFETILPTVNTPTRVFWSTVGVTDCSIYRANGAWRGAIAENVGTDGEYEVPLNFKDGVAKIELRCSIPTAVDKEISAFTEVTQKDISDDTEQIIQQFDDAFSTDYEKKARQEIESTENELEYETERFGELRTEINSDDLRDEIEELLMEVISFLERAEREYDDRQYVAAIDVIDDANALLDEVNDILDDLEDGRIDSFGFTTGAQSI